MGEVKNISMIYNTAKGNDIDMITKFPSDSNIWGPGVWWNIHILAMRANTPDRINEYIDYIEFILPKLPCDTCRNHATEYLRQNPINEFINIKDGMFRWSWIFHNAVNARLGEKQIVNYYTAINIYTNSDVCIGSCGS